MAKALTDSEIAALLSDPKPIASNFARTLAPIVNSGRPQLARSLILKSDSGKTFRIYTRQHPARAKDFSTGIIYDRGSVHYTLIRCNGHHGRHDNFLEIQAGTGIQSIKANTCHVHRATERYGAYGLEKMAHYAEPTVEFWNFASALEYLIEFFGFYFPGDPQGRPFPLFHQKGLP